MQGLTLILLALVAAVAATPVVENYETKYADQTLLVRQKSILQLLNHVMQPTFYPEIEKNAKEFNFEKYMNNFTNTKVVEEFLKYFEHGLLPRGEIFSIFYKQQMKEAISLFHVFYYAKDFETFYKSACWAREYVNEGMFVYALSVAVVHRPDCTGIIMPPPYEIYPYYFVNSEVIQKAYRVKMQQGIVDPKLASYYGVNMVDDHTFDIYANYSGWYVDYNEEQKLSYFTEDIGLNSYYYYFHSEYPFWMGGEEYGLNRDMRGELYYYLHLQMLARYYMERLSNDLGEIPSFAWRMPLKTGFYPSLQYSNGLDFPVRPNEYSLNTEDNYYDLELVEDYEQRIDKIISLGYFMTEDGTPMSLKKPEDIDVLGNLIQSNKDSPNTRFYRYLMVIARSLLGVSTDAIDKHHVFPSAMEHFETSVRDPMFWQLYKRIIMKFVSFKELLPSYTKDQLSYEGVKIENVEIDKLTTYFDYFTYDITNGVYLSKEEMTKQKEDYVFYARQLRLNHQPFSVKFELLSDKAEESIVRIFLGPKYDSQGHILDLNKNRINFVELDSFPYTLKSGKNVFERNSEDFYYVADDLTSGRDLYKNMETALNGGEKFSLDQSTSRCGFPNRLILPKGNKGGMPFVLYVVVSPRIMPKKPFASNFDINVSCGIGSGTWQYDARAYGFPLDREIDETCWFTSNMFYKDVTIFHETEHHIHTHYNYVEEKH